MIRKKSIFSLNIRRKYIKKNLKKSFFLVKLLTLETLELNGMILKK